jgi:hypothetical protein
MDAEAAAAYLGVPVKALRTRFNAEPRPKGSWSAAMDLSSLWNLLWIYFSSAR